MNAEAIEWLRTEIKADMSAALIISSGGFAAQRWDTTPPGEVNPERMPEAARIDALLAPDDEIARALGPRGYWVALYAWERENNEPESARARDTDLPVAIVNDGHRESDHMRRQDPRHTAARCQADLAILERHHVVLADRGGGAHPRYEVLNERPSAMSIAQAALMQWDVDCGECHRSWPCQTLRDVASGYRHRDGYAEHWGEA